MRWQRAPRHVTDGVDARAGRSTTAVDDDSTVAGQPGAPGEVVARIRPNSDDDEIAGDLPVLEPDGGQVAVLAFYNTLTTKHGSTPHMGDNRTGEGDGDDEVVAVDLTRVPVHVDTVFFIVTSYQGQTFEQVQNAFCRLIDHQDGELARYTLTGGMPFTGMVMAKITRSGGNWSFTAIGDGINAKTPLDALPQLDRYLSK